MRARSFLARTTVGKPPEGATEKTNPNVPPSPTSDVPSVADHQLSVQNIDKTRSRDAKLSSFVVDPAAAYEDDDKPDRDPALSASTETINEVLRESSDACTPLKSLVGGLSTILKYYDVRYTPLCQTIRSAHFRTSKRCRTVKQ